MRRRLAADEKTNKNQTGDGVQCVGTDDSDPRAALNGYCKLASIIFLFIAIILFKNNVCDIITVIGDSMESNFVQGDVLVVKKFDTGELGRYDVVIAKIGNQSMIKRVIGLPGETIQITGRRVFVNGKAVDNNFDFCTDYEGVAEELYVLSEREYFLMGDNRSVSYDSRDFGGVKLEQIAGKVVARILPLWRINVIQKPQEADRQ